MSPRTPRITARELLIALRRKGFRIERIRGSHHCLCGPDGRRVIVPVHAGETIGVGLLLKILREAEVDIDELQDLLG